MGIPQRREQPRSQSSSQTSADAYDHLRDLSPFEPSLHFVPAQISGTPLIDAEEDPLSDREPTTADVALRNHGPGHRE